jgi:hypothetical protein
MKTPPLSIHPMAKAIGQASAIHGVTSAEAVARGWTSAANLLLVDLHLEGDERTRIAAIATLLDWRHEAQALGELVGPWSGRLDEEAAASLLGVRSILGEIAQASRTSTAETVEHLSQIRKSTSSREPPPESPALPEPPFSGFEFFELPSTPGEYLVGRLEFGTEVTLLEGGLPGIGNEPIDECTKTIGTQPGWWNVRLVMEASASSLTVEVMDTEDPMVWLILSHDSVGHELGPQSVTIPEVGEWGRLTLVADTPTPTQIRSIRHSPNRYIDFWNWGVSWFRPRCPGPVVLGGPAGARNWIALADPVSS